MKRPQWLVDWLIRNTPPCKDVVRWASQEAEQPLTWRNKIRMHAHFLICEWCRRYRQQVMLLRSALRRAPDRAVDPDSDTPSLTDDAKQRIKDALRRTPPE